MTTTKFSDENLAVLTIVAFVSFSVGEYQIEALGRQLVEHQVPIFRVDAFLEVYAL